MNKIQFNSKKIQFNNNNNNNNNNIFKINHHLKILNIINIIYINVMQFKFCKNFIIL